MRALFRAIYISASAFTVAKDTDHTSFKSEVFPIRRGVLQGDILSPLFFILALTLILRKHDDLVNKGVPLVQTIVHTLTYADDAAQVNGGVLGVQQATDRITSLGECWIKCRY